MTTRWDAPAAGLTTKSRFHAVLDGINVPRMAQAVSAHGPTMSGPTRPTAPAPTCADAASPALSPNQQTHNTATTAAAEAAVLPGFSPDGYRARYDKLAVRCEAIVRIAIINDWLLTSLAFAQMGKTPRYRHKHADDTPRTTTAPAQAVGSQPTWPASSA